MNDERDNQYAMGTLTAQFITDNRAAIKVSKVADAEAADVLTAYAALAALVGQVPISTLLNTRQGKTARQDLLKVLPVIQGPLRSIATKMKDTDLLARATLSSRQLRRMKPEELRDVSAALFDAADAQASKLADYGLDADARAALRTKHQSFADTVRTTQGLIDKRSTGNQSIEDLLTEMMQQIYELDKPMDVFRFLNKPLYDGYKKARFVGKRSGGKAAGTTPVTPA